jgi:hypothetical protein
VRHHEQGRRRPAPLQPATIHERRRIDARDSLGGDLGERGDERGRRRGRRRRRRVELHRRQQIRRQGLVSLADPARNGGVGAPLPRRRDHAEDERGDDADAADEAGDRDHRHRGRTRRRDGPARERQREREHATEHQHTDHARYQRMTTQVPADRGQEGANGSERSRHPDQTESSATDAYMREGSGRRSHPVTTPHAV